MAGQHQQNLASAGVNAASGNYIAAAASIAKSLFGGSGKTPSVLQGFEIQGNFGPKGFQGEVWGFDQKGNRWIGTGETAYINTMGLGLIGSTFTNSPLEKSIADWFAGEQINIPVSLQLPTADNSKIYDMTGAVLATQIRDIYATRAPSPLNEKLAIDAGIANGIPAAGLPSIGATASPFDSSTLTHIGAVILSLVALYFLLRKGF